MEQKTPVSIEDVVIDKLATQRELRGMSYRQLESALREAGAPIAVSSLQKLLGEPPRRPLSVRELYAFSRVFGIPVPRLLGLNDGDGTPEETAAYAAYAHESLRAVVSSLARQKRSAAFTWSEAWERLRQLDYLRSLAGYDTKELRKLLEELHADVEQELEDLDSREESDEQGDL